MIATGGASMTKMARLIAICPSVGVACAFARHMAHPCANAGAVQNPIKRTTANHDLRLTVTLLHSQPDNPSRIGEEKEIHDDEAGDHGKHQHPPHDRPLKLEMHEVPDNQRRLDDR